MEHLVTMTTYVRDTTGGRTLGRTTALTSHPSDPAGLAS